MVNDAIRGLFYYCLKYLFFQVEEAKDCNESQGSQETDRNGGK